ncbi:MAG: DAK2 domain-containing protein [Dehalococcoidia bacterium]|nr:DAK2 domain-containing protein [Dehalococcoidia bacterium]
MALSAAAAAIDAINVYPVPDGDTGSNMAATLREAVAAAGSLPAGATASEVARAVARGALYGARGNSGVILSQALRGLADGLEGAAETGSRALATALATAAAAAYRAVSQPVEGTMLTVLRAAAEAAAAALAADEGLTPEDILAAAAAGADRAEAATMDQLPALREAGVPDSGGEGICIILAGVLASLRGEAAPAPVLAAPGRPLAAIGDAHGGNFGFCVEAVIEADGRPLDLDAVRAAAGAGTNRSVVVVGDDAAAHVHLHTDDAPGALAALAALGTIVRRKVDDMSAQHVRFRAKGAGATAPLALLALSRGAGFDAIFESMGAHVADLGEVVKPPAGDIAAAADATGAPEVLVLPNHKNVRLAAGQAASLASCRLTVVPSASLVEGLAAALAFDATRPAAANVDAMAEAMAAVATVEVTIAGASRTAGGVAVTAGQAIALFDGELVAASESIEAAVLAGLRMAGASEGGLVTLYPGREFAGDPDTLRARVAGVFPLAEVECMPGGQPLYPLIASLER